MQNWLNNNASRWGFRRTVPSEAWHWERPAGSQGSVSGNTSSDACWSTTLNREMPVRACVQSRSDSHWYQCVDGQWYRGVSNGSGPEGRCTSEHAL